MIGMDDDEMTQATSSFLLFLLGTFSITQIRLVGSIGIAEIPVFILAPFLYFRNYHILRAEGFTMVCNLSLLTCVGCLLSSFVNHTPMVLVMKGFMHPYSIFASVVVIHALMHRNLNGYKWLILGGCLSVLITSFVFQTGSEIAMYGDRGQSVAEGVRSGELFWVSKLSAILTLPHRMYYLQTPIVYPIAVSVFMAGFALLTTGSGRSAALSGMAGVVILLICGKKFKTIRRVGKHFWLLVFMAIGLIFLSNAAYRFCAMNGYLGEKQQAKYIRQTKGGTGILSLLMGGRVEFFAGTYACLKKPIIGYGPWALDEDGIMVEFLSKYGNDDDYEDFLNEKEFYEKLGVSAVHLIPAHSHIINFWLWYGISGLVLWVYILWLFYRYLRHDIAAVPQWIGCLAMSVPASMWSIFFSPYTSRIGTGTALCFLLFAHAVARGRVHLPRKMIVEIQKNCEG